MVRKITLFIVAAMATLCAYAQHEPVDLGLSVDWASCNLGASAPERYGAYYAWGETTTKSVFSWNTYRYGTNDALSKYNKSDGSRTLAPEDDAAAAAWGGTWRMPTKAECAELLDKCTWTWSTHNGVSGYIVTGPSGNTIFLPACGQRENSGAADVGSWGCYWSATLNHRSIIVAESLSFDRELSSVEVASRIVGQAVRPVCAKNSMAVSLPDPSTYVDLGLSVKWATCNLGAKNPWECGDYYAWGETEEKRPDNYWYYSYGWCNYKFGEKDFMLKYTTCDGKVYLDDEDDVASLNLGTPWHVPSVAEFEELLKECRWIWTTWHSVAGYKLIGPNGNFIFLPAAGAIGVIYDCGKKVRCYVGPSHESFYWTKERSLNENCAEILYWKKDFSPIISASYRCYGFPVRPVFK